jgi:broad specificity phosphatase PhoE
MKLYLLRHGQTAANLHYDQYPWNHNLPLSDTGRKDVQAIAAWLQKENVRPDALRASPLLRAQQTAHIIAGALNLTVIPDDRLLEADAGDWATRPASQPYLDISELPPEQRFTFRPPHGETWAEAGQRVAAAAEELRRQGITTAILISHSVPLECAIGTLLQAPYTDWTEYELTPGSISCLEYTNGAWHIGFIGKIISPV